MNLVRKFHEAYKNNDSQTMKQLVEKGFDLNHEWPSHIPFSMALIDSLECDEDFIVWCIKNNYVNVNLRCYMANYSLLMMACRNGRAKVVNALIDKGANINATGWGGKTALEMAEEYNQSDIVQLLIRRGKEEVDFESSDFESSCDFEIDNDAFIEIPNPAFAPDDFHYRYDYEYNYRYT